MGNKRKRAGKETPIGGAQPAQKRPKPSDAVNQPAPASRHSQQKPSAQAKLLADKRPFAQDLKPEDHGRERALYKLLGNENVEDRVTAGDVIVSSLLGDDGVAEPVLKRHLERRLFRGLTSGSDAARVGFSYVLVELIGQLVGEKDLASSKYPGLTFDALLTLLVDKTTPVGKVAGQEERDHYWGRLFGLRAFLQSGVLFSDKARWQAVLRLLIELSQKKAWLRSQAGFVIAQALPNLKGKLIESTLEEIAKAGMAKSPEGLGMWLSAMGSSPDVKLPKPWQEPLGTKSLQDVAAVLKGSMQEPSDSGGQKLKQANATTQLHWVWDLILATFMRENHAREFELFWHRTVDQSFFSKAATDNQKSSGFKIFQKTLETCSSRSDVIRSIFSEHLMGCLMNQASVEGRNLNRAALKTLKAIETAVEKHPDLLVTILERILGGTGAYNFDERTNTKTVEKLLRATRPKDAPKVLDTLGRVVRRTSSSDESEKRLRIYAGYVSKLAAVSADSSNKEDTEHDETASVGSLALLELAKLAYGKSDNGLSDETTTLLRTRLSTSFAKVVRRLEDFPYACNAILAVNPDDIDMDEEVQAELVDALERLQDLVKPGKRSSPRQIPRQGLALLHAVAILKLYNEEPDALDVLGDTRVCYEKLKQKQKQKKKDKTEDDSDAGMPEALVEILLSMVAQSSSLMRQTSLQVFEAFSSFMSAEALKLLTDPLSVEESAEGAKVLFHTAEDEMDVDDEDGDEEGLSDLDSDVEFVGIENAKEEDEDKSDASDADSDQEKDEDADDDDDGKDSDAGDDALAEILRSHRLDKDQEAESSGDDSDMTDSEMMALDEKMAEYFKHRVRNNNKRKDNRDAKESVINFKHRVLDLLGIYVKKEAGGNNPVAFEVLLPLLQHIRTTKTKELSSKACGIVLDFSKHRKKTKGAAESAGGSTLDCDRLVGLLREIHEEASKDPSHAFAKAVSSASLAVANVLFASDREEDAARVYGEMLKIWLVGKSQVRPSFFVDLINWGQARAQA